MISPKGVIQSLYRGVLGREPDPDGSMHYLQALQKGTPLEELVAAFVNGDEFSRKIHRSFSGSFSKETNLLFPIEFKPPPNEAGKAYFSRRASGFFARFMAGKTVLDIGPKGSDNPEGIPVVPHAIGVDLDDSGYDGRRLPFADGSVDSVFSSHYLEHIDSYRDVIQDWYRVLRIGGFLICIVPSQALYEKKRRLPSRFNADHKRFYSPASLLLEIQESLNENSYRIRYLEENDAGYDYRIGPEAHAVGCYEIVLVLEKIAKPEWELAE
jgi:predicted SAM-dependent methyltransferase